VCTCTGFVDVSLRGWGVTIGVIANERLIKHLSEYGYAPTKHTPGFFTHSTRPIALSLVVVGIGGKYVATRTLNISTKPSSYSAPSPPSGNASSTAASSLSLGTTPQRMPSITTLICVRPGTSSAIVTQFLPPCLCTASCSL
jgi:hypothetical protein